MGGYNIAQFDTKDTRDTKILNVLPHFENLLCATAFSVLLDCPVAL